MSGTEAVLAIVVLAVFLTGTMIGLMIAVAVGVRREEHRYSMTGQPPDAASRGARRITGLGRRDIIYNHRDKEPVQ